MGLPSVPCRWSQTGIDKQSWLTNLSRCMIIVPLHKASPPPSRLGISWRVSHISKIKGSNIYRHPLHTYWRTNECPPRITSQKASMGAPASFAVLALAESFTFVAHITSNLAKQIQSLASAQIPKKFMSYTRCYHEPCSVTESVLSRGARLELPFLKSTCMSYNPLQFRVVLLA